MQSARTVWLRGVAPLVAPLLPSSPHLTTLLHERHKRFCSEAKIEQNEPSLVDVDARASVVVNDLCVRGITRYPKEQVTSLYQLLLDLGIKTETIEAQLLEMPDLLNYSHKTWTNTCEVMVENGMPSLQILQSIAFHPTLLKMKPSLLNDTLLKYRQMNIGKLNVLNFIIKHPALLITPPSKVKGRLNSLSALFPSADFKSLIRNNPNIITDDWEDIMAKIMYIHKEMGLEQPHIVACKCLKRSLLHIKTRHLFLLRAGLYKKPNLLRDKQSYRRNASLMEIMDTSDKHFTNRIARLTYLEYIVFKDMIAEEELGDNNSDPEDLDDMDEEDPKLSYKKYH